MTTTPPEALRKMGADFVYAADALTETMRHLEQGRDARLKFLRSCITDETARLAKLKEEIRTLPEQIAKWEAERARLESQTGLDLLRAVVAERGEKPAAPPATADPFVPGLPPLRLRRVWAEWELQEEKELCVFVDGSRYYWKSHGPNRAKPTEQAAFDWEQEVSLRPHGKTRAEVEKMADEAEKKPALLDLRGLKVGTVCEATGAIQTVDTIIGIGERFTITYANDGSNRWPVHVERNNATRFVPALVPARVV